MRFVFMNKTYLKSLVIAELEWGKWFEAFLHHYCIPFFSNAASIWLASSLSEACHSEWRRWRWQRSSFACTTNLSSCGWSAEDSFRYSSLNVTFFLNDSLQLVLKQHEEEDRPEGKRVWAQFWASHQRFFKYLCIAAKVNQLYWFFVE